MAERHVRDLCHKTQVNELDFLKILIISWNKSSDPWGAKDLDSRFIYANKAYKDLLNIPENFSVEGLFDGELPAPTSEFQDVFQEHDRKVILLQDSITSLEVHTFGREKVIQPYFFEKSPLYDLQSNCIGTIFHGKKMYIFSPEMLALTESPTSLVFTPPSEIFTNREWDTIFHLNQRLSMKDIAAKLNLSPRTVENNIQKIYIKAGVRNFNSFFEYCKNNGFYKYMPDRFLSPFHRLI